MLQQSARGVIPLKFDYASERAFLKLLTAIVENRIRDQHDYEVECTPLRLNTRLDLPR